MTHVVHKFGTDQALKEMPENPGSIYFITDTRKIYFDAPTGNGQCNRIEMLGSSVETEQEEIEVIPIDKIGKLFQ